MYAVIESLLQLKNKANKNGVLWRIFSPRNLPLFGNWQFVIGNWQLEVGNRQLEFVQNEVFVLSGQSGSS